MFRALKPHSETLGRLALVELTLGNQDTYPGQNDLILFRAIYGDKPVIQVFETKRVRFTLPYGGSCALLGAAQ